MLFVPVFVPDRSQLISSFGRFNRDQQTGPPRTRINGFIRISPIRLIMHDGEMVGIIDTSEAMRRAQELGMDLVEIGPMERPPICKIMDYGKFKYEQSKQAKKSGSKAAEMKEVRLGRSIKIGDHDVLIRVNQSRKFLVDGHKVMVTQRFKGREIAHRDLGLQKLREVADALADVAKVEQTPRWMGKQASIILAPDRTKVEAYKRKVEKEKAERLAKGLAPEVEPEVPDDIDEPDDDDDDED